MMRTQLSAKQWSLRKTRRWSKSGSRILSWWYEPLIYS